mgnify:CR=1 FL=1
MSGINTMEEALSTINKLTVLLEEARKDNQRLRQDLHELRGWLWCQQNGKKLKVEPDWIVHFEDLPQYSVTCTTGVIESVSGDRL